MPFGVVGTGSGRYFCTTDDMPVVTTTSKVRNTNTVPIPSSIRLKPSVIKFSVPTTSTRLLKRAAIVPEFCLSSSADSICTCLTADLGIALRIAVQECRILAPEIQSLLEVARTHLGS